MAKLAFMSLLRPAAISRSVRPRNPAACMLILDVSGVSAAMGSKRYDASRATGPNVVLNVILWPGSYTTYSLVALHAPSHQGTDEGVLRAHAGRTAGQGLHLKKPRLPPRGVRLITYVGEDFLDWAIDDDALLDLHHLGSRSRPIVLASVGPVDR